MKLHDLYGTFDNDHIITEAELCEMARIRPANSGINVIIYASAKPENNRHWARIKVSNVRGTFCDKNTVHGPSGLHCQLKPRIGFQQNFSVSISKNPLVVAGKPAFNTNELEDIFDFVRINYEPLMKFWRDEYEDDADFYRELKRI